MNNLGCNISYCFYSEELAEGDGFNSGSLMSGVASQSLTFLHKCWRGGERITTEDTRVSKLHKMFIVSLVHSVSYWLEHSNSKYFWRIEIFKNHFKYSKKINAMKN